MNAEQYIDMCDQMGWEVDMDQLPKDPSDLPVEAQQALILLNSLPDNWEGMSGSWMGKDYSGLSAIMDIYEIDDRKTVFELLKVAENEMSKYYSEKAKQRESMSKAQRGK
jgi:hypothetical protein